MEQELKRDQEWEADFVKKQQKKKSDSESEKSDELPVSVQEEIEDLCYYVPEVTNHFNVLDKIGEGTFSSVFLASLKHPSDVKEKFALKHIVPTSHPNRMISELKSLQLLGGKNNVIGVELCLKNRDHVVIIMRYFPHQKFLAYFNTFEVSEVRDYMKNLLLALQHIHQYDIIHRDVKPTNFLHNTETKKYALVDFGLAQDAPLKLCEENQNKPPFLVFSKSSEKENTEEGRAEESKPGDKKGCGRAPLSPLPQGKTMSPRARGHLEAVTTQSPTSASPRRASRNRVPISPPPLLSKSRQRAGRPQQSVTKDDNGGRVCHKSGTTGKGDSARRTPQKSATTTKGDNGGRGKEKAVPVDDRAGRSQQKTVTAKSGDKFEAVPKSGQFIWSCNQQGGKVPSKIQAGGRKKRGGKCPAVKRDRQATCACYGRPTVCSHCMHWPNETAHRAGTPGFRAPEVLMKHPHQSTAVDIWAAGVIFLSLLSGRYPFFRGNDDMTCLCQIISLLGIEAVKKAALNFHKLVTSKPETRPLELKSLCERLRAVNSKSDDAKQPPEPTKQWAEVPESAIHLLKQMLDPNPATRITAEEALASEFIAEGWKC